jgi:hypothetical protein
MADRTMDFVPPDLLDLFLPSKEKQMAQRLRQQADSEAIRSANEKANSNNLLEFASQLSNNPGLEKAGPMLAKSTRGQYSPEKIGNEGFMIPETGQFTENPTYVAQKEQDRQQKVLSVLQLSQAARERAQGHDATMAQIAAGNQQARILAAAIAASARGGAGSLQEEKLLDTNTQKLMSTLEKAKLPQERTMLTAANETLDAYKGKDLPGYGRLESWLPDAALNSEGQQVRQSIQGIVNMATRALAGTAVSGNEEKRVLRQIASGKGYDESTLRKGIEILGKAHQASVDNVLSGFDDKTLDAYNSRTAEPWTRSKNRSSGGKKDYSKMSDAELEAAIAAGRGNR